LGKHGEEAAHEKKRDSLQVMLFVFKMLGNFCQPFRDFTRDFCRNFRWIEFLRIEPDRAKPFASFVLAQQRAMKALGSACGA
jgi:hypothetical protein